jgi:hypothetical protein
MYQGLMMINNSKKVFLIEQKNKSRIWGGDKVVISAVCINQET